MPVVVCIPGMGAGVAFFPSWSLSSSTPCVADTPKSKKRVETPLIELFLPLWHLSRDHNDPLSYNWQWTDAHSSPSPQPDHQVPIYWREGGIKNDPPPSPSFPFFWKIHKNIEGSPKVLTRAGVKKKKKLRSSLIQTLFFLFLFVTEASILKSGNGFFFSRVSESIFEQKKEKSFPISQQLVQCSNSPIYVPLW